MSDRDVPIMWLSWGSSDTICVLTHDLELFRLSWDDFVDKSIKGMDSHLRVEWAEKLQEFAYKLDQQED